MSQTSQSENDPNPLQDVALEFEVCARRAVECLLNRPTLSFRGFGTRTRFPEEPEIRCSMETSNPRHSAVISLGLSQNDLRNLLSGEKDAEMALDAIREVVNIIAGRLFVSPVFHSRFGYMRATVPSFDIPGPDMGRTEVLRGVLLVGAARLALELAVQPESKGGMA
jgi:hypothetical protein